MTRYKKSDLLDIIAQSIQDCNWNVLFLEDIKNHPFLLKIYSTYSEQSYLVRIYIWNLTHGGGEKRPVDEYRIQITGIKKFVRLKDEKTLILGWWDRRKVFAGFDYTKHSGPLGYSPSIPDRPHIEYIKQANRIRGWI
jgi:putative restriction endonuclease